MKPTKERGAVLRARAHISFAPSAVLDAAASRLVAQLYDHRAPVVLDVAVHPETQSLTVLDGRSAQSTIVFRPGRALSFWDHGLKAYLDVPGEGMPRMPITPPMRHEMRTREEGERVIVELVLEDAGIGRVRQELVFSRSDELGGFGPALLYLLHCGPACHATSRIDIEGLAKHGLLLQERAWVDGSDKPVMELHLEEIRVESIGAAAFETPKGYTPLADVLKGGQGMKDPPKEPESGKPGTNVQALDSSGYGVTRQALEIDEKLSPDCLGSTRFGAMSATIKQDLLDHFSRAINTATPLLGTVTLTAGTLTVPWLSSLAGIPSTSAGSGLFCLLRNPRVASSSGPPVVAATGGRGLLDRLAVRALRETDASGLTRLEREARDGTLAATLARWGVPGAVSTALAAAGGVLGSLTVDQQIAVVEGYELTDLATVTVPGLPTTAGPFNWAGLIRITVGGIAGTMTFTVPVLSTLSIGSTGNIIVGLALPTTRLTATVTRSLTPAGWGALVGVALSCFLLPFSCPATVALAVMLAFVLNNVTALTVTLTGVTVTLNVAYQWNPATNRVDPFVTVLGTSGVATALNTWVTPNLIGNLFDSLLLGLGNLFNVWPGILASQMATGIEKSLRDQGFTFPAGNRQFGLEAVSGGSHSAAASLLTLFAEIAPPANAAALPYVTQVNAVQEMTSQLETLHTVMDFDVNPQPAAPPLPARVTAVGTYFGLGVSQNALNQYLFAQWRRGDFDREITDPARIRQVITAAPPGVFVRQPVRIHLWPAVAPRVEVSMEGFAKDTRPLVVFFDDVRACFEVLVPVRDVPAARAAWEMSFNLKTTATVTLDWPLVLRLLLDSGPGAVQASDERVWEFVDPNVLDVMERFPVAQWASMTALLGMDVTSSPSAAGIVPPPAAIPWRRPLVSLQQELLPSIAAPPLAPQMLYLDMLSRRRTLYMLTAVRSALLELVDGSGAPTLNLMLGNAPGTVGVGTMVCRDGTALRTWMDVAGLGPLVLP